MSKAASQSEENQVPATTKKRSLVARLMVIGLVVGIVATECAVAYLCLPSAGPSDAVASTPAKPASAPQKAEHEAPEIAEDEGNGSIEVDLGEFCVTVFQPTSNTTMRIDFHLYGSIPSGSEEEFKKLFEESKHRFREQVLVTVRGADIADLTDAGLGLIKRTILDKARRTLGKPLVREVIISDYSFLEQ